MEINFETIRVGNFRKDLFKERVLKENYKHLKSNVTDFVKTIHSEEKDQTIYVDIVIPAKGSRISITLDAIRDNEVKQLLKDNFSGSIYKGDYTVLLKNCMNRPYFPLI